MKALISVFLLVFSAQVFAAANVTFNCSAQEGINEVKKFVIENPYGGGKQFLYKDANKAIIVVTVMAEENQDNKELTDLTLLVDSDKGAALSMVMARGLAKNKYKENGLSTTVFADKNGSDLKSIQISCKF